MGEVFESGSGDHMEEVNIVMEEEEENTSIIIKEEEYLSNGEAVRCLVCKEEEDFEGEHLDIMMANTTTSDNTAAFVIATMMMKRPSEDVTFNNTSMCKGCFDLLDRADELQINLERMKEELGHIKQKFRTSLNVVAKDIPKQIKQNPAPQTRSTPTRKSRSKRAKVMKEVKNSPQHIEELEVEPDDLSLWDVDEEVVMPDDDDDDDEEYTPSKRMVFSNKEKGSLVAESSEGCFTCPECGVELQQKSTFDAHMRNAHILPSMPKCQVCSRHFRSDKELNRHMKRSHSKVILNERREMMNLCSQETIEEMPPNVLTEDVYHYFLNPNEMYICKFCDGREFSLREQFFKHFEDLHLIYSSIKCMICSDQLTDGINHYLLHMSVYHSGVKVTQGSAVLTVIVPEIEILGDVNPMCSLSINEASNEVRKQIPCVLCDLKFPDVETLAQHRQNYKKVMFTQIERKNTNIRYQCPLCSDNFSSLRIRQHINDYHTAAKTLKCSLCPEEYNKYFLLNTHKRITHSIGKPKKTHMCPHCPQMLACPKDLSVHIAAVHRGEKNYICHICGQTFKSQRGFYEHKLRHGGNHKRFRCKLCGKCYAGNVIRKHITKVHKIYDAPRINDPFRSHLVPFEKID